MIGRMVYLGWKLEGADMISEDMDNVISTPLLITPTGYGDFLVEIKAQIRQRQFQALRTVNQELLDLYWWLGENISQRQTEWSGWFGRLEGWHGIFHKRLLKYPKL